MFGVPGNRPRCPTCGKPMSPLRDTCVHCAFYNRTFDPANPTLKGPQQTDPRDQEIVNLQARIRDLEHEKAGWIHSAGPYLNALYHLAVAASVLCDFVAPYIRDRAPAEIEEQLDHVIDLTKTVFSAFEPSDDHPLGTKGKE